MKKFIQYLKDYSEWGSKVYTPFIREHKKFYIFEFIYFAFSLFLFFVAGFCLGYLI